MKSKKISLIINPRNMRSMPQNKELNDYKKIVFDEIDVERYLEIGTKINRFVKSNRTGIIHDKNCHYVRKLKNYSELNDIAKYSEESFCKKCFRNTVIKYGINDDSEYQICEEFFDRNQVPTKVLYKLFVQLEAKVIVHKRYMRIFCNEDSWRLYFSSCENDVLLEHNNYAVSYDGCRYMDEKHYHKQVLKVQTVEYALEYLMTYDYEKWHQEKENFGKRYMWFAFE